MENINKKEKNKIPKTSISNNSYEDFKKICLSYSHILSKLYLDSNLSVRNIFSKEDIFVINDIINEIITYSKELLNNDFINEAKEIIDIGNCIIDNYYCLCDKDLPLAIFKNTLRLKLYILEADFNLNFKYIKDYINSEKILKNIIGYQKYLQLSNFYIGSSFFYLGIIYFFTKRFEDAEKILKISQKFLTPIEFELNSENLLIKKSNYEIAMQRFENNNSNTNNELIPYKISLKKSCNVLRVLGEISLLKKEYIKSINFIENAYYLYNEEYGNNYGYTIFFKNKLNNIYNKIRNYLPSDYKVSLNFENKKINTKNNSIKKKINKKNNNEKNKNNKNINNNGDNENKNIIKYINNSDNKIIEGKNQFFNYEVINTYLYQPLIIHIYSLEKINNNNSSKYLIKSFYFNKNKLLNFFGEDKGDNGFYYKFNNILKIIKQIQYKKNRVFINNNSLKSCLMWNN